MNARIWQWINDGPVKISWLKKHQAQYPELADSSKYLNDHGNLMADRVPKTI